MQMKDLVHEPAKPIETPSQHYQRLDRIANAKKLLEKAEFIEHRGISYQTMKKYSVKAVPDLVAIKFPYTQTAAKIRYDDKQFTSVGEMSNADNPPLFGQEIFPAGSAKSITVSEGEYDALAVFEMFGRSYPSVSVRSSSSALHDCTANFEYLNSFERVYLAFDNDEPGQKALKAVASLFDPQKVYHVKMSTHSDPNAYLEANQSKEFVNLWYNATRFLPEGISSGLNEFKKIILDNKPSWGIELPFPTLHKLCYGLHKGKILLFTALEGRGKTEILRAIEYHLLKHTKDTTIGCIHLEESKARLLEGLVGYDMQKPLHLPDTEVERYDIANGISSILGNRNDRLHLYSHYDTESPTIILDKIRYLVSGLGCEYVFLDHITACVTGLSDDKQRENLDYLSTKLGHMVEDLDFGLVLVSHVNDQGLTRGSRMPTKVANFHVHMERDLLHPDEKVKNTTFLTLKKNRFASHTGDCGQLIFNPATFMLHEAGEEDRIQREEVPYG
jgi:twinkle protein